MTELFLKPKTKTVFFKAVFKFCTTNQLFKYLRQNIPVILIIPDG